MSDLAVETWGNGTPVVLVHGSLATGAEEWQAQRPLADEGFRLLVPDRRGYGKSPFAEGEDYLRDAEDLTDLMDRLGHGAHLVGHSYGGLGVLLAAARRPDATLSLALLEPAVFTSGQQDPAAQALVNGVRRVWNQDLPDKDWLIGFLEAVGSDPGSLPPELVDAVLPLVPVCRSGRPAWDNALPIEDLATAPFPKVVVSGGHSTGFDAVCDGVADRIRASRAVAAGAGHEVQSAEPPINQLLLKLWRGTITP